MSYVILTCLIMSFSMSYNSFFSIEAFRYEEDLIYP